MSSLAAGIMSGAFMAESKVSLRGLKCPLPALKARKLLERMATGDVLVIECTDPLTTIDIPNLLRETGDVLEDSGHTGKVLTFRIRKSAQGSDPQPRKAARSKPKKVR
jgi:tRNA 2-thiouridine synthesizing protein A